jgi:hypothetical protein
VKRIALLLLLATSACSSQSRPTAPPPAQPGALTPTPGVLSRADPTVIEETDTYVIRRLPKEQYIRVDDRHIRTPITTAHIEFFKEDEKYYYVSSPKTIPGEAELKQELQKTPGATPGGTASGGLPLSPGVTAADFEDLQPERVAGRIHLAKVSAPGLPQKGMWRSSFEVADVNGDGIPDIVATTDRMGDGQLHIWLGDGKGGFTPWKLTYSEGGKPLERFSVDYGGVAVGDIDGDGHMDVVAASHGFGLVSLFGDGNGGFEVVRGGLPKRDFSSQAVVLLDANGDGKLDIVASRDSGESSEGQGVDLTQVRVYLFLGRGKGWERKTEGILGAFYSNSLHAWDFDRDGKRDILTGSHYTGALTLLWKNAGDGTFAPIMFDAIEGYSFHFSTAPGTFGKDRSAAFADGYAMQANVPDPRRASGISLYAFQGGAWTRHRVWRKKDFNAYLFALDMGDLDGDGLDDLVFADNESHKLRILFQRPDGSFVEAAEAEEPSLDSPGQCVRLVDLDRDGRLDIVLSKTVSSNDPRQPGGWDVYLNRR